MNVELKKMTAIQRVQFDFNLLYKQQISMQKIIKQQDVSLINMQSRYQEKPYSSTSLFFLTVSNPIRKLIIKLVLNSKFDLFILSIIMMNCVLLVLEDSVSSSLKAKFDSAFAVIFLTECVLKIIAMGFVFGKNSYLTDAWNILDFIVLLTALIALFTGGNNISVLRTIRVLRPLRTINSIPEMKVLTVSILSSIPLLFDIFVLILTFILIFALAGVQLYGGNFSNVCYNIDGSTDYQICAIVQGCQEYEVNCGSTGCDLNQYCWNSSQNPYQGSVSFDNLAMAYLTIFMAMTMEGWSDTMRYGRQSLGLVFLNDIYFYVLIIIGSFFLMQLTVAAIYVNFRESSKAQRNKIKLIEGNKPRVVYEPVKPESSRESWKLKWYRFRMDCFYKIHTNWFSKLTTFIIIVNTLVMGSEYYGMTDEHIIVNNCLNIIIIIFFCFEMLMKLIGLGLKGYFHDKMNIFDGLIVIIGILELSLQGFKGFLVLRAFRIIRIFKLARKWKTLKIMCVRLIKSLKAVGYLALLIFIIMFIYALLGKQLFQNSMIDENNLVPRANFDHLFWSFITVFNLLTAQNWNNIVANAIGGTSLIYSLYFVSFIVIGTFILLNLFLAILIEQFDGYEAGSDEEEDFEAGRMEAGKV